MKKIISVVVSLLLVLSILPGVFAQETTDASNAEELTTDDVEVDELEGDAGIASDSALHGIDRALERIRMRMTFGAKNKAAYGLKVAEERLLEAQAMAKAKKIEAFEKAKKEHKEALDEVESELDDVSEDDPEDEVEDYTEVEAGLEKHRERIAKLINVIDLRVIGKLSDEQKEKIETLIAELEDDENNVRIKLIDNRKKALLRYKAKLGKTDEEVEAKLEEIKEKLNVDELDENNVEKAIVRLEKKIEKLSEIAANLEEKGKDVSLLKTRLEDAKEIVEQIKQLENSDEAKELIKEANQLLNFRGVFSALKEEKASEIKERLQKLEQKREEKKEKIREKLEELKEKRAEKIKEKLSDDDEDDESETDDSEDSEDEEESS